MTRPRVHHKRFLFIYDFHAFLVDVLLIMEDNMNFELIKKNFDRGLWNEKQVEIAKQKGIITEEEYKKIIAKNNK